MLPVDHAAQTETVNLVLYSAFLTSLEDSKTAVKVNLTHVKKLLCADETFSQTHYDDNNNDDNKVY